MKEHIQEIITTIEAIETTSKPAERKGLLGKIWPTNPLVGQICKLALDPFIVFGVGAKSIPSVPAGEYWFGHNEFCLLTALANGSIVGNSKEGKKVLNHHFSVLNGPSQDLLKRILLKKFAAGVSANTINAIQPDYIFLFKLQLAEKYTDHADVFSPECWADGVAGELKEDGWRGVCLPEKGHHFVSRNGLPLNSDSHLREVCANLLSVWALERDLQGEEFCIDCELVEASYVFNETASSAGSTDENKAKNLQVKVIDILPVDCLKEGFYLSYRLRRQLLEEVFSRHSFERVQLTDQFTFHSEEEMFAKFEELKASGKEGLMLKPFGGFWEPKRTKAWLKVKGRIEVDLTVKTLEEGDPNGKYAGMMGSAVCDYVNSKGDTVEVRVGGGWSQRQRAEYWAAFTGKPVPFTTTDNGVVTTRTAEGDVGIVGSVIAVTAHEETKDGSLRHPNFKAHRFDKSPEDGQGC